MFTYRRYKTTRFWSVWHNESLIAVVLYKKGAAEIVRRLSQSRRNHDGSSHP